MDQLHIRLARRPFPPHLSPKSHDHNSHLFVAKRRKVGRRSARVLVPCDPSYPDTPQRSGCCRVSIDSAGSPIRHAETYAGPVVTLARRSRTTWRRPGLHRRGA